MVQLNPALKDAFCMTEFPQGSLRLDRIDTYNGRQVFVIKIYNAELWMPKYPAYYFITEKHYRHAYVHEFGHAFGWLGHSPNSMDIMHRESKTDYVLKARDIFHIRQMYP